MQFVLISLLTIGLLLSGCHDSPHPHENETPANAHFKRYLKMRKKNPDSALIELTQHAKFAFKAHPKSSEWAQLASRLDRAGVASLSDMLLFNQILLEMAKDNNVRTEYLHTLEDEVALWTEMAKELKAEGTDPNTFSIKFGLKRK